MQVTKTTTGIIYCRVSSKEQVEGTSLEMQERQCRDYAKRNEIEVLSVFVEKGESAKTANRTEFNKAISFCCSAKSKVNFFIVYKVDRFARNQDDHAVVRATLKRYKTELRSVTEPIDNTATGRLMEGVISSVAEFDNTIRTERSMGGMMERLKKGIWVWQAPVGFYRPHRGANISPDPKAAHYIKLLFTEYAKGTYSYDSLAKFMAERGFRTRHGKIPIPQLIEKIIKNELYCGIIDAWDVRVKGDFGIISEDLFLKCQDGYKGKARFKYRRVANPDFPLRQTICLTCMGSFTGSHSKGRNGTKYPYYHHHKQNCVNAKFIPKNTFEQFFIEYLNEITPNLQYVKWFKAIMLDIWQSNYKNFDQENGVLRREIEQLEQDRQKVFDLHRGGAYTESEFLEQKRIVNQKLFEKSQLMNENRIEEFDMDAALNYCFEFVSSSAKTWERIQYPFKLRFQKNIFPEKTTFDGEKFGTTKLAKVYALGGECQGKKSQLVPPSGFEPEFPP
jgi:site-specific DNA recombinase